MQACSCFRNRARQPPSQRRGAIPAPLRCIPAHPHFPISAIVVPS